MLNFLDDALHELSGGGSTADVLSPNIVLANGVHNSVFDHRAVILKSIFRYDY